VLSTSTSVAWNMRRLLNTYLQKRCHNLQYLFLRKQGQQHASQLVPGPLSRDQESYHEWAVFRLMSTLRRNSRTRRRESCAVEWTTGATQLLSKSHVEKFAMATNSTNG
jgi:hypothetical protein